MNDERFAQCIRCGHIETWLAHTMMRAAVDCRCGATKQFGPGIYVDDYQGKTMQEAIRFQAHCRARNAVEA